MKKNAFKFAYIALATAAIVVGSHTNAYASTQGDQCRQNCNSYAMTCWKACKNNEGCQSFCATAGANCMNNCPE